MGISTTNLQLIKKRKTSSTASILEGGKFPGGSKGSENYVKLNTKNLFKYGNTIIGKAFRVDSLLTRHLIT